MAAIDLVVTDLDGTLWHTHDDVRPALRDAWDAVSARVPILVATGRRATSTRVPLATLGVAPPAVVLNGALTLDLATGHRYHRSPFAADAARRVLAAFREARLDPCIYIDEWPDDAVEVVLSETPSTHPGHVASFGRGAAVVGDLAAVAATYPVLGFSLIGLERGRLVEAAKAIGDVAEVHLDRALEYPGLAAITVAPRGQSKWNGVEAFCARHGLDPSRVLAIGDGPNDVELLTNAAVRVVPAVAHPDARELADYTIPSAREGGWAAVPDILDDVLSPSVAT